jgi:heme-degrading monooxygenase HmoA
VLAATPDPPYTAVIFTSQRATGDDGSAVDDTGYGAMAGDMFALAARQPGYLGVEAVHDAATGTGITVSYWATEAEGRAWKRVAEHAEAQRIGRERWYRSYRVRVATVGRDYGLDG